MSICQWGVTNVLSSSTNQLFLDWNNTILRRVLHYAKDNFTQTQNKCSCTRKKLIYFILLEGLLIFMFRNKILILPSVKHRKPQYAFWLSTRPTVLHRSNYRLTLRLFWANRGKRFGIWHWEQKEGWWTEKMEKRVKSEAVTIQHTSHFLFFPTRCRHHQGPLSKG